MLKELLQELTSKDSWLALIRHPAAFLIAVVCLGAFVFSRELTLWFLRSIAEV